jgi:hypothetical protein
MDSVTHSEVPAATAPIAVLVVTVVIQTFNRGSILEYAIGSVLRQIFTDPRIRFVDPTPLLHPISERLGTRAALDLP